MIFTVLTSPLDKGENWEKDSQREIEVCKSGESSGLSPYVYFGIYKAKAIKGKTIKEDFFFTTEKAIEIAKVMIATARAIQKEYSKTNKKALGKHCKARKQTT